MQSSSCWFNDKLGSKEDHSQRAGMGMRYVLEEWRYVKFNPKLERWKNVAQETVYQGFSEQCIQDDACD